MREFNVGLISKTLNRSSFLRYSELNLAVISSMTKEDTDKEITRIQRELAGDRSFDRKLVDTINKHPNFISHVAFNNATAVYSVIPGAPYKAFPTGCTIRSDIHRNNDFFHPVLGHFALDMDKMTKEDFFYMVPFKNFPCRIMLSEIDIYRQIDKESTKKIGMSACIEAIIYNALLQSISEEYEIDRDYLQESNIDKIWKGFEELLMELNYLLKWRNY